MNQQAIELLEVETNIDGTYTIDIKEIYNGSNEFLDPSERPYGQVFETGDPIRNWHSRIKSSDGDWHWLATNIEPIDDKEGNIECAFVTIVDITRLKYQAIRLEHQRNKLESELEEVLGRITDAFYALDAEWQFTYLNNRNFAKSMSVQWSFRSQILSSCIILNRSMVGTRSTYIHLRLGYQCISGILPTERSERTNSRCMKRSFRQSAMEYMFLTKTTVLSK
ncbi:putative PAS/PAC sensor protein [Natronococcus jeotgali DSM 18795]|uniref:Putative PAS/PAC sensor protein n=1 Tax=Natronococcus jeotgali DSM 18795 TaxID=1227498 RepID=L9XEC2_9EURY|nr:putative PAS/PAC sensor protein [Natronococcus jeotgali DSM 18795]